MGCDRLSHRPAQMRHAAAMKPRIDLLLLDADGVLLHCRRTCRVLHLARALQLDPARVSQALAGDGIEARYDSGDLGTTGYLQQLEHLLQRRVPAATWVAARAAASQVQHAVIQRLLSLPPSLALGVLTNNGALMADVLAQLLVPLQPRLHGRVLCSGALGVRKPDPVAFARALQRLHTAPQHTLFVDDLFRNVRGARAAGLHADTVNDARSLGKVLRRYGL